MFALLRRHALVAPCLLVCAGCETGTVVPGLVRGGANRPPVIAGAKLERTGTGLLKLSATVFDPDGDGITVRYEQRSGPFAAQQSALLVGGAYAALLKPAGDSVYAFRLVASDGFFDAVSETSFSVGDEAAARTRVEPSGRALPSGRFKVRLAGQAVADEGFGSFALDATLDLSPPDSTYAGRNDAIVTLRTSASPLAGAAPAGSLALDSAGSVGGSAGAIGNVRQNDGHVLIRLSGQSGPLEDLLDLSMQGADIILTGPSDAAAHAGVSAAQFRSAESRGAALDAGSLLLTLRLSGDAVTGAISISTRDVPTGDLPRFAEYSAQITGTRAR